MSNAPQRNVVKARESGFGPSGNISMSATISLARMSREPMAGRTPAPIHSNW